jgi:hypothetical protein
MGLTEEPNSQRKSRSVTWGEAVSGKLASSKTMCQETIRRFVERSSSDSLCDQKSSQGRHTGWTWG